MRFHALATDYDGTIAHDGAVDRTTLAALERLKQSGRKLVLVTGRVLPELREVFPPLDLFDMAVIENGAALYAPATKQVRVLAEPPPPEFAAEMARRGVKPIITGHVIVASFVPHETVMLETIRDMGLKLQVIFNKDAVMVLPASVNKASGLTEALAELGLAPDSVVGVGDAENDHAFLTLCGCAAAVANALPAVKETADLVTHGARGAGVAELIAQLIASDLAHVITRPRIGTAEST